VLVLGIRRVGYTPVVLDEKLIELVGDDFMRAILPFVAGLFFIASCGGGGDNNSNDLMGSSGLAWPGPTDEYDQWINVDLDCASYRLNLTGSSSDAKPPNDPEYAQNTFWSSTSLDGTTISQGIWYTSKADNSAGSSLTLEADTSGT